MSELTQSIKELYQGNISDGEVELVKDNLLGFFKLLQEIELRIQQEQSIQEISTRTNKQQSKTNEENYENNRS